MGEVVGRAVLAATVAGVVAALLALPAAIVVAALKGRPPSGFGADWPLEIGQLLVLLMMISFAGALAGAVFGLAGGVVLGAMRTRLTGRPGRCRIAGTLVFGGLVGSYALILARLGTSPGWWFLLCASELVVAVIMGWWRGPVIVDGRAQS